MFTDVHAICGYIIGKYLYEKGGYEALKTLKPKKVEILKSIGSSVVENKKVKEDVTKKVKNSIQQIQGNFIQRVWRLLIRIMKKIFKYGKHSIFKNRILLWIKKKFITLSFKQRFILVGVLLANLPDIDMIVGVIPGLGKYHSIHRTWTHSVPINMVALPVVAHLVRKYFLASKISYWHTLLYTVLCVGSHLLTDFITVYGTGIFYPFSEKLYSMGVITVWDFTTVVYFYFIFTFARTDQYRMSNVFWVGLTGLALLMLWKRSMLCSIYSKSYYYMENIESKENNVKVWLHPNNVSNGRYSMLKFDPKLKTTQKIKSVVVANRFYALFDYILASLPMIKKRLDYRVVELSTKMGYLQGHVAPRPFYENSSYRIPANKELYHSLIKSNYPTIMFIVLYHLLSLIFSQRFPY